MKKIITSLLIIIFITTTAIFATIKKARSTIISVEVIKTENGMATIEYIVNKNYYQCDVYYADLPINLENVHKFKLKIIK